MENYKVRVCCGTIILSENFIVRENCRDKDPKVSHIYPNAQWNPRQRGRTCQGSVLSPVKAPCCPLWEVGAFVVRLKETWAMHSQASSSAEVRGLHRCSVSLKSPMITWQSYTLKHELAAHWHMTVHEGLFNSRSNSPHFLLYFF